MLKAASSAKSMSRTSIGTDPSHVEEFTVGACMEVHTVSEGFKGKGLEEREKDSKECRRVLGLRHSPVSHRF